MKLKPKQIHEVTGRSWGLILGVRGSKSLADFHKTRYDYFKAWQKKNGITPKTPAKASVSESRKDNSEKTDSTVALLGRIARSLEEMNISVMRMEEHWRPMTGEEKKKFKLF